MDRPLGFARIMLLSFTVGLSGALMPGPLTIGVLDHAARGGWHQGLGAGLGHVALELVMVVALLAGLGRLMAGRRAQGSLALAGGLVLLFMAWGMLSTGPSAQLPGVHAGQGEADISRVPLVTGVLATLANPYWFIWWATVGAAQLAWARGYQGGIWAFWAGHAAADLLWLTLLSLALVTGLRFLPGGGYGLLLMLMGGAMAALGVYFLAAARRLFQGQGLPGRTSGAGMGGPGP